MIKATRARQMREMGRPIAASGVEAAAFTLVGEADRHLDLMRAELDGGRA